MVGSETPNWGKNSQFETLVLDRMRSELKQRGGEGGGWREKETEKEQSLTVVNRMENVANPWLGGGSCHNLFVVIACTRSYSILSYIFILVKFQIFFFSWSNLSWKCGQWVPGIWTNRSFSLETAIGTY